jgi:hypothetical protein
MIVTAVVSSPMPLAKSCTILEILKCQQIKWRFLNDLRVLRVAIRSFL